MQIFSYEKSPEKRKKIKANLGNKEFRVAYFEYDFFLWCVYYFGDAFTNSIEDFHKEWMKIATSGKNLLVIAFRSSGKTAILGLMYIVYCICYNKEPFILFLAFTQKDAVEKLRNIITVLKTNQLISQDYGYLFDDGEAKKKDKDRMQEMKSVTKFITTNGIRVQAMSLDTGSRGLQFVNDKRKIIRPSFVVCDDVDVIKSVKNIDVIDKNYDYITNELFGAIEGRIFFLGNIIGEDGVVPRLKKNQIDSPNWIVSEKALIENGEITWKDKFCMTDEEVEATGKKSIQTLRRDQGEMAFGANYLNIPYMVLGEPVFVTENVQRLQVYKPIRAHRFKVTSFSENSQERIVDVHIFKEWNEPLCVGVDVGGGNGGDYTDITYLDKDKNLIARLRSNLIKTEQTGEILKHLTYNYNLVPHKNGLGIERNNFGIAVINALMDDKDLYRKIYMKTNPGKTNSERPTRDRGWVTTGQSKEIMIGDLRIEIDNGQIQVDDIIRTEMLTYIIDEDGGYNAQSGCYDDSVISYAIALQMTKTFRW